jgi:hypothetical protein
MKAAATRTLNQTSRQIGPSGTFARVIVGVAFIVLSVFVPTWARTFGFTTFSTRHLGPSAFDIVLGLVVFPAVVVGVLGLRGRTARPLRLHGPLGHAANIGLFIVVANVRIEAALLFYGASMLIAAWRGFSACELFAVSNAVLRRDDQLGCPLFLPVDAWESRGRKTSH